MLELRHDTGVQEISINGKVTVLLNLTDIDFIERVFNAFDAMDKQQDKYQAMRRKSLLPPVRWMRRCESLSTVFSALTFALPFMAR